MDEDVVGLHAAEPREVLGVNVSPHRPAFRLVKTVPHVVTTYERQVLLETDDPLEAQAFSADSGWTVKVEGRHPSHAWVAWQAGHDICETCRAIDNGSFVAVMPCGTLFDGLPFSARINEWKRARTVPDEAIPSTPSTSSPRTAKQTQKDS